MISALRTVDHRLPLKTAARCVSLDSPCCRKCSTRRWMAATAHVWGWPVAPFLIDYALAQFLCVIKRKLEKVAAAQVEVEAVVAGMGWVTTKNWMLWRVKGVETVYVPPAQYLLGRSRKKNLIHAYPVDGLVVCCKLSCVYLVRKYL